MEEQGKGEGLAGAGGRLGVLWVSSGGGACA